MDPIEDRSVLDRPAPEPDAVLRYGSDDEQLADLRTGRGGPPDRPVVVLLHGGFWRPRVDRVHVRPMTEALAEAGWTTVAPEYRRVPGRPDVTVGDVHAAVRAVAAWPGTEGRAVVLAGHSAGGHLALLAAATLGPPPSVVGVLALAPVADLVRGQALGLGEGAVEAFLGEDATARPELDPARLPAPAARVRILHGTHDAIVPFELSESYLARHPAAEVTPLACGHFGPIDPAGPVWAQVLAALDDLARGGGGVSPRVGRAAGEPPPR